MVTMINEVKLKDYNVMHEEKSGYKEKTFSIDCQSGQQKSTKKISFPYCVSLLSGKLHKKNILDFDKAKTYIQTIQNDGVVNALGADIAQNETLVQLAQANPFYMFPGSFIVFPDNEEYEVLNHDQTTNQITLVSGIKKAGGYSSLDSIKARFYNIDIMLFADEDLNFAESSFGSKLLVPQMELVVEYEHNIAPVTAKTIYFLLRYYHGDKDE